MAADGSDILTGMVISAAPVGEYDRRIVLLTRESGKITAFAKRARRQGSSLMAAASPFAFGKFRVLMGRNSNSIVDAEVDHFFEDLRKDVTASCYGQYFLEVMNFITRENNDESQLLLLLYVSLRALEKKAVDNALVRVVFELRTILIEGEFEEITTAERSYLSDSSLCAIQYIVNSPLEKLYHFTVSPEVLAELIRFSGERSRRYFHHDFTSLSILGILSR